MATTNKFSILLEQPIQLIDMDTGAKKEEWRETFAAEQHSSMTLAEFAVWLENGGRPPGIPYSWRVRGIVIVQRKDEALPATAPTGEGA